MELGYVGWGAYTAVHRPLPKQSRDGVGEKGVGGSWAGIPWAAVSLCRTLRTLRILHLNLTFKVVMKVHMSR